MSCQEFLARYSEYLDDRLDPIEASRWRAHAERCASCARYDRVLRRGLDEVRQLPRLEPSPEFSPRLQHRLFHVDDDLETGHRASGASAVISLAIAGVLAAVAWSPMMRPQPLTIELAPMEARAPSHAAGMLRAAEARTREAGPGRWYDPALYGTGLSTSPGAWLGAGAWWSVPDPAWSGFVSPAFLFAPRVPGSARGAAYSPFVPVPPAPWAGDAERAAGAGLVQIQE